MNFKINNQHDRKSVASYIEKLPDGKQYDVSVSLRRKIRSLPQNSLYWLWIGCICAETGNEKKDLHEVFSVMYLPIETNVIFGHSIERPISTTKLNTKQFTDYLDRIQQFASSELGIILPDPKDLYFAQFYEQYKNWI